MKTSPYSSFDGSHLDLRDKLAIDRTLLANERTLMAYLRSAMALIIAGVTIIHFSAASWFWAIGLACLPTSMAAGLLGALRYRRMNRLIHQVISRSLETR